MGTFRVFRHYIRVPFLILAIIEAVLLGASVYLGAYLRFGSTSFDQLSNVGPILPRALIFSLIMLISLAAVGLYQTHFRERSWGILLRLAVAFALGGLIVTLVFYLFPDLYLGRGVMALSGMVGFLVLGTTRPLFFHLVDDNKLKTRTLVLGAGRKAALITERMRRKSDQRSVCLLGFMPCGEVVPAVDESEIITTNQTLLDYSLQHGIEQIVVALDERRGSLPTEQLLECKLAGIEIIDLISFFERHTGSIALELLDPGWLIFSEGFRLGTFMQPAKRTFDIIVSLLLLLLTWPIMLLSALAIKICDGWGSPVMYRQVRVGKLGMPFNVYKFRSMRTDAEKHGVCWASSDDHRVTRIGKIIRKLRIDELPQIFNVLIGDMSFVGPRPERPEFVNDFRRQISFYSERHRVKPGITGWAQLCYPYGASEKDAKEKLQFDLYYVKHYSLLFDLVILLQTVEVVLFGKGAR